MSVFGFCSLAQRPASGQQLNSQTIDESPALIESEVAEVDSGRYVLTIQSQANYLFTDPATDTEYRGSSRAVMLHSPRPAIETSHQPLADVVTATMGAPSAYEATATLKDNNE